MKAYKKKVTKFSFGDKKKVTNIFSFGDKKKDKTSDFIAGRSRPSVCWSDTDKSVSHLATLGSQEENISSS